MARQRQLALEGGADDMHIEMPAPVFRAGVAGMAVAVVLGLQQGRLQRRLLRGTDALHPFATHGSTFRKGRTSVRTYTPAST